MELKDLNTENFVIDPKVIETVDDFNEHYSHLLKWPEFNWIYDRPEGLDEMCTLRYIAIMYDRESELRNKIENVSQRKSMAASMAGFKKRGNRYNPTIESMLIGNNNNVNMMIIRYCRLQGGSDWQYLIALEAKLDVLTKELMKENDNEGREKIRDILNAVRMIREDIELVTKKIVSNDVSKLVKESLYNIVEEEKLMLMPEELVRQRQKGMDEAYKEYDKEPELIVPIAKKIIPDEEE